jgi:prepilin-type N-terminal cleavage/methylation domain-containing protein
MPTQTRRHHPAGFTLIELLVVIAILAVLFALTTAAVMKIMDNGPRVQTRVEIGDLETSLRAAMSEMGGVDYVPSRLYLMSTYPTTGMTQEQADSLAYLKKLFGSKAVVAGQTYNWGPGGTALPAAGVRLTGPEVLAFILGGVTDAQGNPQGFSRTTNPAAQKVGSETRYGPYYTFAPARLRKNTNNSGFLYYLDPYGMPYLFFSRGPDGLPTYDTAANINSLYSKILPDSVTGGTFTISGVLPYQSSVNAAAAAGPIQYMNPQGWQIISAGKNKLYGPGGPAWTPQNGYAGKNPNGNDDLANFQSAPLAVGSN